MPNINPDRDNPNIPGYNPNIPGRQGWGSPNPNIPNYDPNQSWGAPNQDVPGYNPNQQNWGTSNPNVPGYNPNQPGQGVPGQNIPGQQAWGAPGQQDYEQNLQTQGAAPYAAPTGTNFNDSEWKMLMSTPLKVGKAMMFAAPSGPIGMIQEAKALSDCLKGFLDQGSPNPLLNELAQNGRQVLNSVQSGGGNAQVLASEYLGGSRDPQITHNEALDCCQQSANILRKASPQDATAYKEFVCGVAQKVAGAAGESGFLGFGGGPKVSPAEQNFMGEIVSALGGQMH